MGIASVTRIHIRPWARPAFMLLSMIIKAKMKGQPGYRGGSMWADKGGWFWTLTAWDNEDAMKAMRGGKHHRKGMKKSKKWATHSMTARWDIGDEVPTWEAAARELGVEPPRGRGRLEIPA